MQCPKCETQDVVLCSTAYAQGKSTTTTSGSSTGSGYDHGTGRTVTMNVSHESTSETITEFAKKAAPPENDLWAALGGLIIVLCFNMFVPGHMRHTHGWITPVLLIALGLSIWWVFTAIKNQPKYRAARALWEKTWICARCATKFQPTAAKAAQGGG